MPKQNGIRYLQNELACLDQYLQQRGSAVPYLIEQGIAPSDSRLSSLRRACKTASVPHAPGQFAALPPSARESTEIERLSGRPTFDCSKAKTPTARILCIDKEGAKADWDLSAAYFARTFSLQETARDRFRRAHDDWFPALSRACNLRIDQSGFSAVERQCVLNGFRRRTESYRSQLTGDALVESKLSPDERAEIQRALIALHLLDGDADGEFGGLTRAAIKRFQAQSGFPISEFLAAKQRESLTSRRAPATATAQGPSDAAPTRSEPEPPATQPPRDTARLKEARFFLDDIRRFISEQTSVDSIPEIAKEAASLQIALDRFDEAEAVQSVRRLNNLLRPIGGFETFVKGRQAERDREGARQLVEAENEASKNVYFIDNYLKAKLGDPKTSSLIKLREQIVAGKRGRSIEDIDSANKTLQDFVKSNQMTDAYTSIVRNYSNPPPTPPPENRKLPGDRLGLNERSKFLIEGSSDDVVLMYNASPSAPSVWRNVRGDIVFQGETASLCFSQSSPSIALVRYAERKLRQRGARSVVSGSHPCNLSRVASSTDIIAFQRGGLLNEKESYVLELAKLVEGNSFREFEVATDYSDTFQRREAFSLQIEAELQRNAREGFGIVGVSDAPTVCVIPPAQSEQIDRERELIAPSLTADLRLLETTTDLALRGLQRRQCGFAAGESGKLRELMEALRRDQLRYSLIPVWFDTQEVARATFDAHDAKKQEVLKQEEQRRKKEEEDELERKRRENQQSQKGEIERQLRQKNGVRARALTSGINDLVKALAEKRIVDAENRFPSYSAWLNRRFADQWETFNVASDIADFGTVEWNGRSLDAIVVKSVIQQKNRVLGKYDDGCFIFGLVDDVEFKMHRDLFSERCEGADRFTTTWKIGKKFRSQWNAGD